jgi:hypothetical protein
MRDGFHRIPASKQTMFRHKCNHRLRFNAKGKENAVWLRAVKALTSL